MSALATTDHETVTGDEDRRWKMAKVKRSQDIGKTLGSRHR
jgi:hypothetical protein